MDSVVEKITLYDLLGYMIPGSLFLIMLYHGCIFKITEDASNTYEIIICSYVCGMAISEVARWISKAIRVGLDNMNSSRISGVAKHFPGTKAYYDDLENGIGSAVIKKALQHSKLVENHIGSENLVPKYAKTMYSDIQTDPKYKRIHNYASAEVMYKNIAFAAFLGSVMTFGICFLKQDNKAIIIAAEIVVCIIFFIRWTRFEKKKEIYTVLWFIEKHNDIT